MPYVPVEVGGLELFQGDCLRVFLGLDPDSVDAVVTDPPYGLEFMGKEWDRLAGDRNHAGSRMQQWHHRWAAAALRVLKPSGYMLAFGGTRTYHRLACAVEDAGFEVRDCIMWLYGSGFPKGKGCLKPAWEPILLCRKPGKRVLPLGIEECRVALSDYDTEEYIPNRCGWRDGVEHKQPMGAGGTIYGGGEGYTNGFTKPCQVIKPAGRWPANVCHDGSPEVLEAFAAFGERKVNRPSRQTSAYSSSNRVYAENRGERMIQDYGDTGTAARFFYCAKASRRERGEGNGHPTVKPLALMEWLVKLVCPPGGTVLDPFLGSGTTLVSCAMTGRRGIGIERDPTYFQIAEKRIQEAVKCR